jgi:hypothetical protein
LVKNPNGGSSQMNRVTLFTISPATIYAANTDTNEPRKKIVAARRRGPIIVAIHGIKPQASKVPPFNIRPLYDAERCATAIDTPEAVSREMIKVGAQNVQDHRPKMMHAIMLAAAEVVRA